MGKFGWCYFGLFVLFFLIAAILMVFSGIGVNEVIVHTKEDLENLDWNQKIDLVFTNADKNAGTIAMFITSFVSAFLAKASLIAGEFHHSKDDKHGIKFLPGKDKWCVKGLRFAIVWAIMIVLLLGFTAGYHEKWHVLASICLALLIVATSIGVGFAGKGSWSWTAVVCEERQLGNLENVGPNADDIVTTNDGSSQPIPKQRSDDEIMKLFWNAKGGASFDEANDAVWDNAFSKEFLEEKSNVPLPEIRGEPDLALQLLSHQPAQKPTDSLKKLQQTTAERLEARFGHCAGFDELEELNPDHLYGNGKCPQWLVDLERANIRRWRRETETDWKLEDHPQSEWPD